MDERAAPQEETALRPAVLANEGAIAGGFDGSNVGAGGTRRRKPMGSLSEVRALAVITCWPAPRHGTYTLESVSLVGGRSVRSDLAAALLVLALFAGVPTPASSKAETLEQVVDQALSRLPKQQGKTELPIVMGASIAREPGWTRFVVELSDPVQMRAFTLTDPDRVVIDMPAVQWRASAMPRPAANSVIRGYRYGLFRSGNSRIVIDLASPVSVQEPLVLPPARGYGYRVLIDLLPTTEAQYVRAAGWPADLKAREAAAEELALGSVPARSSSRAAPQKVIVVDPGHGGIDSGTNGIDGMMEKDLVLDEGVRLAHALSRNSAFSVHMTRDSDIYVPLSERVRIARSWNADLFISLHADSNPDPTVNGLSIYTLSERGSDKEASALARKENQSDIVAGVDLGGANSQVAPILIDLAQRDTLNRSTRFALSALDRLSQATDVLPRQPHRSAAFVVLESPDVPAVLIELGYLSNSQDAARMETGSWRDRVAAAIAHAVERQFTTQAALDPSINP